ncbi:unnamed protein product [Calypogeia fissa]
MLEAVSDRPPSTIPTGTQTSINNGYAAPKPGTGATPKNRQKNVAAMKENQSQDTCTRKPRQRKSRAAPPILLDVVKEGILQSSVLKKPLTPLQENLISDIRLGSASAWAMSPKFLDILQAFSVGAMKKKEKDEVIILT